MYLDCICLYIIELIVQIISIKKFKKTHDSKYWNIFIVINVLGYILNVCGLIITINSSIGIGYFLICMIGFGIVSLINFIIFLVGIVHKIKSKVKLEITKELFFTIIATILLNIIVIIIMPMIMNNKFLRYTEKYASDYLTNKYGVGNYKMVDIINEYENIGIIDKYLIGYNIEMKSDFMDDTFTIYVDDDFRKVDEDNFLPVYYSKKYNLKYKNEYDEYDFSEFDNLLERLVKRKTNGKLNDIDVSYVYELYHSYDVIPTDEGRIPTISEIVDKLIEYNKQ